ncbi:MAG: hypothetical protein ACE5KF_04480 [Kiloniellaceae bacterium]
MDHAEPRGVETIGGSNQGKGRAFLGLGAGFAIAALALAGIFNGAEWYADRVSMPRYCDGPEAAAEKVGRILTERQPASGTGARPYIVAAKLIYLAPRRDGETVQAYTARLRRKLAENCR